MKLTDRKIRYLAGKIAGWLAAREGVTWVASREVLVVEMARVLREELQREDALEAEVEQVIARHRKQIGAENLDVGLLRQKIKRQLARERGIVL